MIFPDRHKLLKLFNIYSVYYDIFKYIVSPIQTVKIVLTNWYQANCNIKSFGNIYL